jgi:UDP-N-acetylglucosamine--N-acetylmuramyl-(pentapeptide) pyrophosphoryl-undecaprenol N-acetylglucosamine transferase
MFRLYGNVLYFEEYKKYNSTTVQVVAFIERMDFVYASADIIISRAGHVSSELSIVGKPVILFLLLS